MKYKELEFLRESNNIEDEWDDKSLEDAIIAWQYIKKQPLLTEKNIKRTHALLMRSRNTIDDEWKGIYRDQDILIGIHIRTWQGISPNMDRWIVNANDIVQNGKKEYEPYLTELINNHHIRYEEIHPFLDGNGRTGRIFLNWKRVKLGLPILVIKEEENGKYYEWFR